MPAPDGANTLDAGAAPVDAADIELTDIALRRPSLDEVFFALTDRDSGMGRPSMQRKRP